MPFRQYIATQVRCLHDDVVVNSTDLVSGALVVPLMTPAGCVGVLAIELRGRREEEEPVRALAMIFAAQLAALVGAAQPIEASDRRLA